MTFSFGENVHSGAPEGSPLGTCSKRELSQAVSSTSSAGPSGHPETTTAVAFGVENGAGNGPQKRRPILLEKSTTEMVLFLLEKSTIFLAKKVAFKIAIKTRFPNQHRMESP